MYKRQIQSGVLGLGWYLNVGGTITREVKGIYDEEGTTSMDIYSFKDKKDGDNFHNDTGHYSPGIYGFGGLYNCLLYTSRHSVGSGDTLFLLAVAPLFAPTEFLWFLIAACVVALLWWGCCGRRRRTIPFVGAAGIVLIGWAALQFLRLWP